MSASQPVEQKVAAPMSGAELRYHRLFEAVQDGVLILDAGTGVIIDANPFLLALLGCTREVLLGKQVWELGFFKGIAADEAAFSAWQDKDLVRYDDLPLETATGRQIEVEIVSTVYQLEQRRVIQFNLREITTRKQAEEALRTAEAKYRYIIDNTHDVIFQMDLRGNFIFSSAAAERMTGYTVAELLRMNMVQLAAPEHHPKLRSRLGERIAGDVAEKAFEFEILKKTGERVWVELTTTAVLAADGALAAVQGVARNIAARKHAEEALRDSETLYQSLFENMLNGFSYGRLLYERGQPRDFVFLATNSAFEKLTGLKNVAGKRASEAIPGLWKTNPALLETYARVARTGVPERFETYVGALKLWFDIGVYRPRPDHFVAVFDVITQRKHTEEALRAETDFVRAIIARAAEGLCVCHAIPSFPFVRFTVWNERMTQITGYTMDEINAHGWYQSVFPDPALQRKAIACMERARAGDDLLAEEWDITRADGNRRSVVLSTTALASRDGTTHILALLHDVTAREQAVADLRRAEEKYHSIFEHAAVGIFQSTPDGTLLAINPAFAAIHGYASPAECIAAVHNAAEQLYVDPGRRQEFRRRLEEQGEVRDFESQVYRKDGSVMWVSTNARVIRDAQGQVLHYEGFVSDITQRKRSDESQARLAAAVEQAAETIVITDPTGAILYVNPAFERVTGYTRAEAQGQNPRILQSGQHDAAFYRTMWTTLLAGKVWSGHFVNRRKDGTHYEEEATISPILDAAGRIINFVAVKRDVTREVLLEAQHRQAVKMEVVGQLAGGVAHDFNNKLQIIMGCAEMLLKETSPDHPFHADLLDIQTAAHHSADLTRQLLAFSRQQAVTPVALDVNAAISGGLKMLGRLIGENIQLSFVEQPGIGQVFMDPVQLDQILGNLAVNSRDAIAGTGKIVIAAAACTLGEDDCRDKPDFVTPGDYIVLTFRDDGAGMTPEVQAHLFEPFFTTKDPGKGTGLGLAMVYGIVKQNHGAITVRSAPRQGTTFSIYLPCLAQAAPAASKAPEQAMPTGVETVLVAEDEENILNLVRRTLEQQGYQVLTAALPHLAVELCTRHPGPIHLLVSDVIMPEMSGTELAGRIQKLRPGIRILYMSGYSTDVMEQHGHLADGLQVLAKPFATATLAQRVRAALDAPPTPPP